MAFSMSSTRMAAPLKVAAASSFKGDVRPLAARPAAPVALRAARLTVSAADAAPAAAAPAVFVPPPLDPNTPSPIFGGSTGGLLRKAQVRRQAAQAAALAAVVARRAKSLLRLRVLAGLRIATGRWHRTGGLRARRQRAVARGVVWNGTAPRARARRGRGAARRRIFCGPTTFFLTLVALCACTRVLTPTRRFAALPVPPPRTQVEEFYVITWTAKKEQIFEMPV
jgi:hypothetical protein